MERRQFMKGSVMTAGSLAANLAASGKPAEGAPLEQNAERAAVIGRPVRAVSIAVKPQMPLDSVAKLVDEEASRGTDIVILPETCRGQNEKSMESLDGPTVTACARLAAKHRTYIVCPIDRMDGTRRYNTAVLLDRRGQVACMYDKLYPVWQNECAKTPPVLPGQSVTVHQADFGRVGLAICFDVNWAPLWRQMSDLGAELVIWPSAYTAGRSLQAQAINFNYYVISATWVPDCLVFDIDGEQLSYEHNNRGNDANVTRVTFDLDRCIFHQDINIPAKLEKLLKERGDDVAQEKWLAKEGWFVLKARRPGVSARELARQYGLEELRHYINRSRCEIDKNRGWVFV
jgi:predicted amidohydrolase